MTTSYTVQAPNPTAGGDGAPKKKQSFETLPENTALDAKVLSVKEILAPYKDRDTGADVHRVEFEFTANHNGQERRFWGETSTKMVAHPECKLHWWSQEILGYELGVDVNIDIAHLTGLPCRIILGVRTWTKDGVTREKNFVKDVMRARSGGAAPAPAPQIVEDPF